MRTLLLTTFMLLMVACAHGQGVRNPVHGVAGGLPYGGYGVYGNRVLMQANRFSNQVMYRAGVRYFYPRNPYLYQRSRYTHEDYSDTNNAVPEATTFIVWSLLGLSAVSISRRCKIEV